jgi:hypothetical protein
MNKKELTSNEIQNKVFSYFINTGNDAICVNVDPEDKKCVFVEFENCTERYLNKNELKSILK